MQKLITYDGENEQFTHTHIREKIDKNMKKFQLNCEKILAEQDSRLF